MILEERLIVKENDGQALGVKRKLLVRDQLNLVRGCCYLFVICFFQSMHTIVCSSF